MEPLVGIEPPSLLTRQVPSQMATRGAVPVQGFEPRSSASKTAVLPLDDTGSEPSAGIEPTSLEYETSALPLCYEGIKGLAPVIVLGIRVTEAEVICTPVFVSSSSSFFLSHRCHRFVGVCFWTHLSRRGGRRTRTLVQAVYSRGNQPVECPLE